MIKISKANVEHPIDPSPAKTFVNSSGNGLKVKMPDSVHVFLPGEVIEFVERPLDKDGVKKELERRERRKALKIKATVAWKKAQKEKA